jgi:TatD DNase family protein
VSSPAPVSESGRSRDADRRGEPPPPPEPLRSPALDSHCHLDLMDVPVDQAMSAARAAGIARVVQVGIDVPSSRWSVEVAQSRDDVWAAVAIHPNEAHAADETAWQAVAELATRDRVVAIGETGLDHFRTEADGWAKQEESFRRHIQIAKDSGRALMIHDRDAHDDVLRVLASEGAPDRVVFHCFSGDARFARRCADLGYVMSFAGTVTFNNAANLREAAALAPLELMLVETDAPFLTPMPYRGRPNAPYLVPLTVRALAEVKGVTEEQLAEAVTATAARTYRW